MPEESRKSTVRKAFRSFDGEESSLRAGGPLVIELSTVLVVWYDQAIGSLG